MEQAGLYQDKPKYLQIREIFYSLYRENPCMASMLRLAWHDCGTYDLSTKTGGPNASILQPKELAYKVNGGLSKAADLLKQKIIDQLPQSLQQVSKADIIQIAGYSSVEFSGGPDMSDYFRFGRKDIPDDSHCPQEGRLPDAKGGVEHLRTIFYRMGLNDQEIVALSGGHTLGSSKLERTGFGGKWTKAPNNFDNTYFVELLQNNNPSLVRLPSDEALLLVPEFKQWVEKYAQDQNLFFTDYAKAYKKLSELGYE